MRDIERSPSESVLDWASRLALEVERYREREADGCRGCEHKQKTIDLQLAEIRRLQVELARLGPREAVDGDAPRASIERSGGTNDQTH